MHKFAVLILALALWPLAHADQASQFVGEVCRLSFKKTDMPETEKTKFCSCVEGDVAPRLTQPQKKALASLQADLIQNRAPKLELIQSSGVRDLIVAGQARCETALYAPIQPISIQSGEVYLSLTCDDHTHGPMVSIYLRRGMLLSKKELDAIPARLIRGDFDADFASVVLTIDGVPRKAERWEIDVTGQIVISPKAHELITRLRSASSMDVVIERGSRRYTGSFPLNGKIPVLWKPCE